MVARCHACHMDPSSMLNLRREAALSFLQSNGLLPSTLRFEVVPREDFSCAKALNLSLVSMSFRRSP